MKKIRCLLVDDEPPAIELLETYIGMVDHLSIVGKCHSAIHAYEVLKTELVHLLFLDIRMPLVSGIDFLKSLSQPPAVIFTTAYREYAVQGYDLDVVDYLLKPIGFDRFLKAVDRYHLHHQKDLKPRAIYVNINRSQHKILLQDIIYIESLKDYVRVHAAAENWVVKGNLGSFMKRLQGEEFIRIHRSFAISLDAVKSYSKTEVSLGTFTLPLGSKFRDVFFAAMKP